MSSLTDYLDGENNLSFDEFLDDTDINENYFDDYSYDDLNDEEKVNVFKAAVKKAKGAYFSTVANAKKAYDKAVKDATNAYVKASGGVKKVYSKGCSEVTKTIEEIKNNKQLAIKIAVTTAAATAAVIGVLYLIFRKKK